VFAISSSDEFLVTLYFRDVSTPNTPCYLRPWLFAALLYVKTITLPFVMQLIQTVAD